MAEDLQAATGVVEHLHIAHVAGDGEGTLQRPRSCLRNSRETVAVDLVKPGMHSPHSKPEVAKKLAQYVWRRVISVTRSILGYMKG